MNIDDEDWPMEYEPSWWHYFWYLFFGWLLIPLVVAIWKQASVRLRIYTDRVVLEKGLISKRVVDLAITDINTVEIRQSFCQRLCRIGDIRMATSGVEGYEITVRGFAHPEKINATIAAQRRKMLRM